VGAFTHTLRGLARGAPRDFTQPLAFHAHLYYYQSDGFGTSNAAAELHGQHVE
jgi:hypothetical protein